MALIRSGWCVVYIVDYPASSVRQVVFHKVVRQHYSGEVGEFLRMWCKIFSWFSVHQKLLTLVHFSPSYCKDKRESFLRHDVEAKQFNDRQCNNVVSYEMIYFRLQLSYCLYKYITSTLTYLLTSGNIAIPQTSHPGIKAIPHFTSDCKVPIGTGCVATSFPERCPRLPVTVVVCNCPLTHIEINVLWSQCTSGWTYLLPVGTLGCHLSVFYPTTVAALWPR